MKKFLSLVAIGGALLLSSCMGKQNQAPSEGVNLDSERIYGTRGAEPRQLKNKYDDPSDETLNRIEAIQNKLFPKPAKEESMEAPMEMEADTTATDTTAVN